MPASKSRSTASCGPDDIADSSATASLCGQQSKYSQHHGLCCFRLSYDLRGSCGRVIKPSVGFGGHLTNNLFRVEADRVEIPYWGMMAKRAPPADFLQLKPLQTYRVKLDLSADYDIPQAARMIEVRFEHTNHFSVDAFQLYSPRTLSIQTFSARHLSPA
jgi:hypothetical protein